KRALPQPGAAGRSAHPGRQGHQAPPPSVGLQRAGFRGRQDGVPRGHYRRAAEAARRRRRRRGRQGEVAVRRPRGLPPEDLAPHLLSPPDPPRPLNWVEVFGNDRPVEVEVGFGKGLFLLTASEISPETNFLGVEIVRKYQLFTATRMAVRRRQN